MGLGDLPDVVTGEWGPAQPSEGSRGFVWAREGLSGGVTSSPGVMSSGAGQS